MTTPVSNTKSWVRDKKKTGWAAFNRDQRQKRGGLEASNGFDTEPFPSLLSSSGPKINNQLEKPFVSVVEQKNDYPAMIFFKNGDDKIKDGDSAGCVKHFKVGDFSSQEGEDEILNISSRGKEELGAMDKLKDCYPWADKSLIEDILVGVDNNINEAASLLKVMELSSEGNTEHENVARTVDEKNTVLNCEVGSLEKADYDNFISEMILFNGADLSKMTTDEMSVRLDSIPIEPEFEEGDVYLVHRRDALKVMRSASHHSKAASDAYLKGDHLLAQHHSSKSREEWKTAERLNAEAAKEILNTRNSKNDMWTLDLHGLHSAEAVEALQEHLLKIEFQTSFNQSSSSTRSNSVSGVPISSLLNSSNFSEGVKGREVPSSSQKPTTLHVITGKGNHSRGQAALPAAIRSFLIENGYRFDEARPGVIEVRPKFRRG